MVHVWATEERLLLGQKAVDDAAAEGSAALELLRMLDLGGATVTADAAYCTSEVTTAVREAGAHHVLSLKGNRDALHRHVRKRFADADEASDPDVKLFKSRNAGHGRIEYRIVRAMPLGPLPARTKAPWTDLKTVVQIDRVRATDHMSVNRAYYITSHRADPKQLAARIRSHWSIENQLHHCLHVSFADDRRGIRSKNGSQNFALINRQALSLLKREHRR